MTDTHLVPEGRTLHGVDPVARLKAAIQAIEAYGPDLCVLLGDLVDGWDEPSYAILSSVLAMVAVPVRVLAGNHDDRDLIAAHVPGAERDENGFIQSLLRTPEGDLLFLDTTEPGTHEGRYCEQRMAWLERRLAEAAGRHVFVFMHHPPVRLGLKVDRSRLREAVALGDALEASGNVRHIFFGHTHRSASGTWRKMGWTNMHGTSVQSDLATHDDEALIHDGPAQFCIADIHDGDVVVHFEEFTVNRPVLAISE